MSVVLTTLWTGAAVLLSIALFLTVFRLVAGPGTLDRLVSLDTFAAVCQCGIGVYIAWTRDTTPASAIVALALIGFLGSVAVTRFRVPDENVSAPTGAEDEEGTAR